MASRFIRVAADLALVSIKVVRPHITKIWSATKSKLSETAVKPIVSNAAVTKLESALNSLTNMLVSKMTKLRDRQLSGEEKYLEEELKKVKKKLGGSNK